jgi:putative two-component system response regulator
MPACRILDASGCPQGLRGDEILPGARILSVADVVEAMAARRPCRPGLGIDAALTGIARHRGVNFDLQAVDACIRLFREDGYRLK